MSRTRPDPAVTPAQSLAGLLLLLTAATAVIALAHLLLPARGQLPPLDAPAQSEPTEAAPSTPGVVQCPAEPVRNEPVGASTLIDCPDLYDGRQVTYRGEVIGHPLQRGDRAWVQLNDDPYALLAGPLPEHRTTLGGNSGLGVNISRETAAAIQWTGGHDARGDVLTVTGVFRRAGDHGNGEPTIYATRGEVSRTGHLIVHRASGAQIVASAILAAVAAVFAVMRHRLPYR